MNCSRASLPEPKKGEIDFKNLALLKAVAMKIFRNDSNLPSFCKT